jgi:hypothetical protein
MVGTESRFYKKTIAGPNFALLKGPKDPKPVTRVIESGKQRYGLLASLFAL